MLPQKAIQEFKVIYKKQYGVELSDEEASFRANNLISLYRVVYTDWADRWLPNKEKHVTDTQLK